jgi:hypothetical protein
MPSQFQISQIIQFQQISQYLAGNDKSSLMQLQSGSYVGILPSLLYMEGTLLQNMNSLNPSSSTLRGTAEYVLSLCGKYLAQAISIVGNLTGYKPVITGPANEATTVGGSATFTVSVTSATPYVAQWYLNGVIIPGAVGLTYTISSALLSQNGNLYSVMITNLSGQVVSNQAVLTVTAGLVASYYFGATDFSTLLEANSDTVPYIGTFPITTGQPLSFTWPSGAANNQFIVVRYPATESTKTAYANAPLNNGLIPSIAFASVVTFGGFKYIFSRTGNPFSQNTSNPLIFT